MKKESKVKVGVFKEKGKTTYFKIPKKDCYFIDVRNPKEREVFAYSIVDTELCGLDNDGHKKTWEEAFEWAVKSKLPLIVYKDGALSRVIEADTDNIEIVDVKYSTQEQVQAFAQSLSIDKNALFKQFRTDLEAMGMYFDDKEYDDLEEDLSAEIYMAYIENRKGFKKELLKTIRREMYDKDRIYEYFIKDEATEKSRLYQIMDRTEDNFITLISDTLKSYSLSKKTMNEIKKIINRGEVRRLHPRSIVTEYSKYSELNPQYGFGFEFSYDYNEDKNAKPDYHRRAIFAFDLDFLRKKTKNEEVITLINTHEEIAKLVYAETKVRMPLKLRKVQYVDKMDEEYDFLNETDREYWEHRASSSMLKLLDEVIKKFIEIIGRFKLKYNKYFISLTRTGEVNDFIYFRPRKSCLEMYFKGEKNEKILNELEDSGVDYKYDWIQNRYQITIRDMDEFDKYKKIIFKMVKKAIL